MERKIMIEVSEQELALIKDGALVREPKEPTLKNATFSQLIDEITKRVPKENKRVTTHCDKKSNSVIGGYLCEMTYWDEHPAFQNIERECIAKISVETTGITRTKGEKNENRTYNY